MLSTALPIATMITPKARVAANKLSGLDFANGSSALETPIKATAISIATKAFLAPLSSGIPLTALTIA